MFHKRVFLGLLSGVFVFLLFSIGEGKISGSTIGTSSTSESCVNDSSHTGLQLLCDAGIQYSIIDVKSNDISVNVAMPVGKDRRGNVGVCEDVNIPANSSGPGCEDDSGNYPRQRVHEFLDRYPDAVVAVNGDFFDSRFFQHGPEGLTVSDGKRLDGDSEDGGTVGDIDGQAYLRPSVIMYGNGSTSISERSKEAVKTFSRTLWDNPDSRIQAIGGCPLLVFDGVQLVTDENHQQKTEKCSVSSGSVVRRTAIGLTYDDRLVIAVAEDGLTLSEFAFRLKSAYLKHAMNLDGGGSSQMWYSPKYSNFNSGYDLSDDLLIVSDRPVANAIVISHKQRNVINCPAGQVSAASISDTCQPTPVVSTPTRASTTPTPVATSGAPVSCSNIGWFNQSIAHTFSEKNCLGDSSWNSQHEPNGPGASRQKSIYVPVGKVLKIYQHDNRGGRTECLSGSFPDLSAIGWENGIQSAYLENGPCFQPTATVQPAPVREVKFYNETNFEGGRAFTLGEGNHYPRDLGHGEKFHKFESMRICEGCVVNVYDSVGEDRCWVYDEDKVGNHGLYGQDAVRIQISTNANPICTPWHPKWTSPQEGSVYAVGQDVVIGWRAGDEFSDRFTVEVWRDGVLGYNQVRSTNTTTTLRNVQVGSYKVRLQSHWGSNYSVWRDRYFTVMGNPSKPNILSPQEDQVFQVGESVEVQWRRTDLVTSQYAAQVWCDWKLVAETGRVSSTWKNFESLPAGDCMVQVETYNQVGYSGWTQRLFKVRPEPPASPDIYHPTEGQAFHSRYTVLIGWHAIPSAVEYNVELWGPNGLVESWIGTRELVLVAGHLPQGTYRVRIHSVDKYGQYQEWKNTTFITVDPTPTPINTAVPTATVTDTPVPTVTEAATATKVVPTSTSTPIPAPSNTATPLPPTATPIATTAQVPQPVRNLEAQPLESDQVKLIWQLPNDPHRQRIDVELWSGAEWEVIDSLSADATEYVLQLTCDESKLINIISWGTAGRDQPDYIEVSVPCPAVEGPEILSPTSQEIEYGKLFVLHYSEIEGAIDYELELVNMQTNQSQIWGDPDTEGDFDPEIAYPEFGSYKWRVRAMLENNNYTDWSAWAAFNFQMPEEEQNIIFLPVVIR